MEILYIFFMSMAIFAGGFISVCITYSMFNDEQHIFELWLLDMANKIL